MLLVGAAVGVALYFTTQGKAFTSTTSALTPPAALRPFGWPLRLQRRVNVLLIGVDSTIDEHRRVLPYSRSDTLLLVSFDPRQRRINAVSIPRDSYAQIPGQPAQKINAAYAFGGPRLTIQTVENLLGVPVPYYVKLGAASFTRIVNALGGIEIDVEKDMHYTDTWADLHINLKKGRQVLSGDQVAQYIRYRADSEGDLGRVQRQQKVLRAIFHKIKSPAAVLSAPRLVQAFRKNTQTNLSASDLLTLALFVMHRSADDVHTATLPGEAGPVYVSLDEAQVQRMVADLFVGMDVRTLSSAAVEVLNGSGVPGLARLTATRLERLGFRIVRIDTAPQTANTTTVISHRGRAEVARALADLLGQQRVTYAPGRGADITVVVAQDLRPFYQVKVSGSLTPQTAPVSSAPTGQPTLLRSGGLDH
jgi:LCP family protein required for cell wall assembly